MMTKMGAKRKTLLPRQGPGAQAPREHWHGQYEAALAAGVRKRQRAGFASCRNTTPSWT
jgi:hypothetical protein